MIATLFNPVTIALAVMSLQWIVLFGIKLPYLAIGAVIAGAVVSPRRLTTASEFIRSNAAWIVPYASYTVFLSVALHGSDGANMGPRQIFYLVGCVCFAACLCRARQLRKVLRVGSALSIFLFVATVEVLARRIGMSWLGAATEFFQNGNLHYVQFVFLRGVFNALYSNTEMWYGASAKNGIAVTLLIAGLLFRSASKRPSRDPVGSIVFGFVLILLFLLNTRSVMIVGAISVLLALGLSAAMGAGKNLGWLMAKVLAVVAIGIMAFIQSVSLDAVSATMGDRFAFDDASAGARIDQINFAIERIQANPLTGNGYLEVNGYPIHNLFLSSWMHAGILAFVLVVIFYVVVIAKWIGFLIRLVKRPQHWVLPIAPEWIAALPILPLFRVWLSGDGGHPFLGEWIALAAFFGCILANERQRRRRQAPRPVYDPYGLLVPPPAAVQPVAAMHTAKGAFGMQNGPGWRPRVSPVRRAGRA